MGDFLSALAIACGGFLLAVLWMDLMFDVQVLRYRQEADLPEDVLRSIAAYYRRVTTDARLMSRAIGMAMLTGIAAVALQWVRGDVSPGRSLASLLLIVPPVALAAVRVVPNAVRLGGRTDSPRDQSRLARRIFGDHVFCLAAVFAFVVLRLWVATS